VIVISFDDAIRIFRFRGEEGNDLKPEQFSFTGDNRENGDIGWRQVELLIGHETSTREWADGSGLG